jgi:hypothetical protein
MPFVCTLRSEGSLLPAVAAYPKLTSLVYPIGYDDLDGSAYQLFISFGSAPGGIIEYSFCIVCSSNDGTSHDIWDSREVAAVISKDDRAVIVILRLLLETTAHMVKSSQFPEVTMHTFARDLPQKALAKYRDIAQVFYREGYGVRTEERRGQQIWWFDRKTTKRSVKPRRPGRR